MPESPQPLRTIDEVVRCAKSRLASEIYEWAAVGAGEGVTVARNRLALNALGLVPRVGVDVSSVDTSSSFMGLDMAFPVFLAPVAALGIMDPGDAETAGRSAARASISACCPVLTTSEWRAVADTAPGRHIFQIYVFGDRAWLGDLIDEVEDLGFGAICVTLDSAVIGRRDGSIESGYIWQAPSDGSVNLRRRGWNPSYRTSYTWDDYEWLCDRTSLPVAAKGVMKVDDAITAARCGASAVYVSNHGGRMVDHAISTIEALPAIVEAVGDTVDVAIDGGFMRGAEILKAVALGADAVGIGRLQCWGMAAGGEAGLDATLGILAEEISLTMASLGCRRLSEVSRDQVRASMVTSSAEFHQSG